MIVQHLPATLLGGRQPLLNSNRRRPASYVRSHDLQVINLVRVRPQRNPVGPGSKWIPERASSSFSGHHLARSPLESQSSRLSSGSIPEATGRGQDEASTSDDPLKKGADGSLPETWGLKLASLPLEFAAANARTNDHWLEKRRKSKWWKLGHFPKVPAETLSEITLPEAPVALWRKVIPLALIFFCASANLTILQNLKDAILVTAAGAEVLPWVATFCVLPASLLFLVLYSRLVAYLPPKAVFYAACAPLLVLYIAFTLVLYPASTWLHPHGFAAALGAHLPIGLHGLLKVIENWTFSLFFCGAELWGSVVISVLFWSLANEVCTLAEAKTIYPMMGIAANIALVVAGNYMKWVNGPLAGGSMILSLRYLVGTVVALSVVMFGAKAYVDARVVTAEDAPDPKAPPKKKKKKGGSIAESWAVLRSSPRIMNLGLLVMSYGVSHRLFEFAWKGQLRVLYPSPQLYQGVLADVSIATGYLTIALMITGRWVFQSLGWGVAALATPVVMLVSGSVFFGCSLAAMQLGGPEVQVFGVSLAAAGVMAGAITQVFARSSKFSLFDPAKEMVYIEMDKEEKSKGKAAVDLLGSQIGKSGASWITQALLLGLGSITASLPVLTTVFVSVIFGWIRAVAALRINLEEHERNTAAASAAKASALATSTSTVTSTVETSYMSDSDIEESGDNWAPPKGVDPHAEPLLHSDLPKGTNGHGNGAQGTPFGEAKASGPGGFVESTA